MKIVYNLEPDNYSTIAESRWRENGFIYSRGSWNTYKNFRESYYVEVLITRLNGHITSEILDYFPNVKILISATTGINHIDICELESRGVLLFNLRGHDEFLNSITSTAELTWALILNLIRSIPKALKHVEDGGWNRDLFKGSQLKDKNLGIVGLGRIGRMVAAYGKVFGMNVQYFDPNVEDENYKRINSLEKLAHLSDILTIHIHPDAENLKLINKELIKFMKKGIYIVNTSRGEVWNELDVLEALNDNHIEGVASDVLLGEIDNRNKSVLWLNRKNPKILLTPHIGGASNDAMWLCEEFVQKLCLDYYAKKG